MINSIYDLRLVRLTINLIDDLGLPDVGRFCVLINVAEITTDPFNRVQGDNRISIDLQFFRPIFTTPYRINPHKINPSLCQFILNYIFAQRIFLTP